MTSKVQKQVDNAQREVDRLTDAKEQWDQLAKVDPGSQHKADQAAIIGRNLERAKKALKKIEEQAAKVADPKSPEAKADLKRLDKINKEGADLTDEITAEVRELAEKLKYWEQLRNESRRLGQLYEKPHFDLGLAGSRLISLGTAIIRWLQEYDSWERHMEIMAQPPKPIKPKPGLVKSEREKMLDERYPSSP